MADPSVAGRVPAAMRNPAFYSHRPDAVETRETHTSFVFLAGDRVYKTKKPVRFPFLDYSTLERRRFFCQEEVRLNRRLAPDVYMGVVSIVDDGTQLVLGGPDDQGAVEYAVEMRRLPEERTLEHLVISGQAGERELEAIARRIAQFHCEADRAAGVCGGPRHVKACLDENFETLHPYVGTVIEAHTFEAVRRFCYAFAEGRAGVLAGRPAAGRIREGHGDLRAEHVVLEDGHVTIYDCVEFDPGLRWIDIAADLAFLVMDLERLGARELATILERVYAAESDDPELAMLLPFYACYRACVRSKVACLRMAQLADRDDERDRLAAEANSLLALAHRFAWHARLPVALVLCGVGASGKSVLAERLSVQSGLAHLSSDAIRKELAGVAAQVRGGEEIYEERFTIRTYEELARRARAAIEHGGGAVIDATFLRREHRRILLAALSGSGARVLFCECSAPVATLQARASARERVPERGSDATWQVVKGQFEAFQALEEVPPSDHLLLKTDRQIEESLDELDALVSFAIEDPPSRRHQQHPVAVAPDPGGEQRA